MSRLFGPRNRRRGPGTGPVAAAPRALLRWAPPALVLAAAVAAWPTVGAALRRHPYFAVSEVLVVGQARLAPDRVRSMAGIEPGMSIWDVDCVQAEARLHAEPWIRAATVRRQLPHRVTIQLREERPVAILAAADPVPSLYYVSAHGRIFARLDDTDARDFPYLTGLHEADLVAGDAFGVRAVRHALGLLHLLARGSADLGVVSEVHVDRSRGLTLLPVHPTVPIELGWGRFEAKLGRLPAVLALWAGREDEVGGVSLAFDDEVIVRRRPPATPPRGRRPTRT